MKILVSAAAMLAATLTCSLVLRADTAQDRTTAYASIKRSLGFVPEFMKAATDEGIGPAWDEFAALEMSKDTALPGKVKELVGLGVAAQIPCRYCVYAHTQFAKLDGAGDRELKEAVAIASITRHWSTVLNGMQIDPAAFDAETAKVFAYLQKGDKDAAPPAATAPIVDAASAYKDIERTLGVVPQFLRAFPASAIAPAWREMKMVQLNPATALSGKYKELIGLAVAAQIPCKYCVVFHTRAARLNGATDQEIAEAVGMAAMTRFWSTTINGSMQDEQVFRRDIDQLVKNARKEQQKEPQHASR